MKTAMQIAVESLISEGLSFTDWFAFNYERLLEKEKEQIINAYVEGGEDILLDRSENNIDFFGNSHEYYNQSYNQNKQNFCYSCGGDKGEHALFCQFCRLEH